MSETEAKKTDISVQEAYHNFTQARKDLEVWACHEYDSRFVFLAVPKTVGTLADAITTFDSLFSVEKKNGEVTRFLPTDVTADEYKRGKRITIYDRK